MEEATQNMGDYKLKSASDYVVGDEQRMSTDKKRRQLLFMRNMVKHTTGLVLVFIPTSSSSSPSSFSFFCDLLIAVDI